MDTADHRFLVISLQGRSGRIYDAVLTVARGIERILDSNGSITPPPVANGLCRSNRKVVNPWKDGKILMEEMKKVSYFVSGHYL